MSQIPNVKRLTKEDFPEAPEWFERYLETTNSFFGDVTNALGSQITRNNLSIQTESFQITTLTNPSDSFANGLVTIKNKLGRKPIELRLSQVLVKGVPAYTPGTVVRPALLNSWVNYGGTTFEQAGYYQDGTGHAHLVGLIKNGTPPSVAFTLPAQFRPAKDQVFAAISNDAISRIDVQADGDVFIATSTDPTNYVSLHGIHWLPFQMYVTPATEYTKFNPLAPTSWEYTQNDMLQINSIEGLAPLTTYDITITIE